MASITSEDKKILDGSDPSDLDYLMMDLGESDLELDLESCPSSPVLRGSFQKQSNMNNSTGASSTQPCKFSGTTQASKNKVLSNTPTGADIISQSQPVGGGQATRLYQTSPVFKRKMPMQLQISPVMCLEAANTNTETSPILLNNSSRKVTPKLKEDNPPKRAKLEKSLTKPGLMSDDDSDVISLYARDEDYMSLYTNNSAREKRDREVKLDDTVTKSLAITRGDKKRNVVIKTRTHDNRDDAEKKSQNDLRYRIPKKNCNNPQEMQMTKIIKHLEENTRSQTLLAAAKFCKAYMDHQIKRVNRDFITMTRKLAEMLLYFKEMRHLYRIVRLALDMQIMLSDHVLSGLIDNLGQNFENGKISVILTQIREKSICCGKGVQFIANQYLHKKNPKLFARKNNSSFPKQNYSSLNGSRKLTSNTYQNTVNVNSTESLLCSDIFGKQISPEKTPKPPSRNVINTETFCKSMFNWKKDPLHVKISNNTDNMLELTNDGFGCNISTAQNDHAGRNDMRNSLVMSSQIQNPTSNELSTTACVDVSVLGKCFGQIVEAVGSQPVTNMLFCAFADMLAIDSVLQESPDPEQDVCSKLVPFLEAALQVSSDITVNKNIYLWLSRIGVEVNRRLPPDAAYKMAQLMKTMGLMLVPTALLKNSNTPLERKIRFQIADKIIRICMDKNDLDLSMEVMNEYFANSNVADAGPVLAPRLCKMVCRVADLACSTGQFLEAAKCLSMLPAGLGDGTEMALMEKTLIGIITTSKKIAVNDINICNKMVEQMLSRNMVTQIRNVIVKAFCANVVPLFKFLEGKGVYRRPQIAACPHLIIVPFCFSVEEIALVVQRHLTELCEFLMEMNEKIRIDIPLRIVLCRNVGRMQPLVQNENKDFRKLYDEGLKRVLEAVHGVLNPSLRVDSSELNPERKEFILKVNIDSVKMWMLANTDYNEGNKSTVLRQI